MRIISSIPERSRLGELPCGAVFISDGTYYLRGLKKADTDRVQATRLTDGHHTTIPDYESVIVVTGAFVVGAGEP